MTSLDSSSNAESGMDDNSNSSLNNLDLQPLTEAVTDGQRRRGGFNSKEIGGAQVEEKENGGGGEPKEGDGELWRAFSNNFRQVQTVLDRNRLLIQQVNENHQSKIHENMVKNVALIQEINENISKVVSLYSDLSANFSSMVHAKNNDGKGKKSNS